MTAISGTSRSSEAQARSVDVLPFSVATAASEVQARAMEVAEAAAAT